MDSVGLNRAIFVPNELLADFFIIPVINKEYIINQSNPNPMYKMSLSLEQKKVIGNIFNMYENSPEKKKSAMKSFSNRIDCFENIKVVRDWWNSIPHFIKITSVGRVLAHSYAKKCDDRLPELND